MADATDENAPPLGTRAAPVDNIFALVGTGRSPLDSLPKELLQDVLYQYWKEFQNENASAAAGGAVRTGARSCMATATKLTSGNLPSAELSSSSTGYDVQGEQFSSHTAYYMDAENSGSADGAAHADENQHPNFAYEEGGMVKLGAQTQESRTGGVLAPLPSSASEYALEGTTTGELRTDPSDGYAYTKAQFEEHYGRTDEWEAATPWVESNAHYQ